MGPASPDTEAELSFAKDNRLNETHGPDKSEKRSSRDQNLFDANEAAYAQLIPDKTGTHTSKGRTFRKWGFWLCIAWYVRNPGVRSSFAHAVAGRSISSCGVD